MSVGDRIRELREERKLSREKLAELVGCHPSYVAKVERGERKIKEEWAVRFAKALGVDSTQLWTGVKLEPLKIIRAPLIGWSSAGRPAEAIQQETLGSVPVTYNRATVAAVKIRGHSINRVAPDDSIVVFDYEDKDLLDRKYYLFLIDGEVTAKQYRNSEGPIRLEPDSTDRAYQTIYPTGPVHVIGRIIFVTIPL